MGKGDRKRRRKKRKKKPAPISASTGSPDTTLGARGLSVLTAETMTVDEGGQVLEFFPASEPEPEEDPHAEIAALREELDQQKQINEALRTGAQVERTNAQREIEKLEKMNLELLEANGLQFAKVQNLTSEVERKRRENADLQQANNELAAAKSQAERSSREASRAASDARGEAARQKAAAAAADARIADLEAAHADELEALQAQVVASQSSNYGDRVLTRFHRQVTGDIQRVAQSWDALRSRAATFLRRTGDLVDQVEDARFQAEQAIEEVEDAAGEKVWSRSYENFTDWVDKATVARAKREALQAFAPALSRAAQKRDQIDAESQELQQQAKSLKAQLNRTARVFKDAGIDLWEHFDVDRSCLEALNLTMGDSEDGLSVADLHTHDLDDPDFTDAEWLRRYDKAVEPVAVPSSAKSKRTRRALSQSALEEQSAPRQNVVLMPGSIFTDKPECELERLTLIALFVITKGGEGGREADYAPVLRTLTQTKLLRVGEGLPRQIDRSLKRWHSQRKLACRVDHSGAIAVRLYAPNDATLEQVNKLLEKVTSGAGKNLMSRLSSGFYRR